MGDVPNKGAPASAKGPGEPTRSGADAKPYEPPALALLGSLAELTRQQLKVESGTDFSSFRNSF